MPRYRCHVGHAFTADAVLSARGNEIERMLEGLLRSHRERAALAWRLVERERGHQRPGLLQHLEARARDYDAGAETVRRLIMGAGASERLDSGQVTGSGVASE